jgi:hypothetical protein
MRRSEAGIALLISIFILLLISVVAIALIVSSSTETALAGNYRSSTAVYYAALSGLEEARSRLLANNPGSFKNTASGFIPLPGNTMAIGSIAYVLNPSPDPSFGENQGNLLALYPDTEYDNEFGAGKLAAANAALTVKTTPSVWNTGPLNAVNGTMAGPLYKWVRINPISETALNLDVSPFDGIDPLKPVFYDVAQPDILRLNDAGSGQQVFEITSLAVLPNGSQKLLQYLVTSYPIALPPFLAALTLSGSSGNGATYHSPNTNTQFFVSGNDHDCSGALVAGPAVAAIGVLNSSDVTPVTNGIPSAPPSVRQNYNGLGSAPDVEYLNTYPAAFQTPSQLDAIAQNVIQNADATVPAGSNSTQTTYLTSLGMSPSKPLTVVAGDLDISNWSHDGYGLLLVTGTFTYDPDTNWNGVILVIGQGIVQGSHQQYKQINGAMFVAKTGPHSSLLPALGGASVVFDDNMQGNGIRYSSCWIQKSQPAAGFKILSFHEIAQQ